VANKMVLAIRLSSDLFVLEVLRPSSAVLFECVCFSGQSRFKLNFRLNHIGNLKYSSILADVRRVSPSLLVRLRCLIRILISNVIRKHISNGSCCRVSVRSTVVSCLQKSRRSFFDLSLFRAQISKCFSFSGFHQAWAFLNKSVKLFTLLTNVSSVCPSYRHLVPRSISLVAVRCTLNLTLTGFFGSSFSTLKLALLVTFFVVFTNAFRGPFPLLVCLLYRKVYLPFDSLPIIFFAFKVLKAKTHSTFKLNTFHFCFGSKTLSFSVGHGILNLASSAQN
jgi:hypothetical protein